MDKVEDVVNVGDQVIVKVIEIDDQGRINLSRRDALVEVNGAVVEPDADDVPQPKNQKREGRGRERKGFKKHD